MTESARLRLTAAAERPRAALGLATAYAREAARQRAGAITVGRPPFGRGLATPHLTLAVEDA